MRSRRSVAIALVAFVGAAGTVMTAQVSRADSSAQRASASSAFSKTETITRDNLDDGKNHVVDKRTVTMKVDQTTNLRGRQEIGVSWSGAHPTGGIVADQNSSDAQQEEYPFVLMECRGTASQVTQKTCWTQTWTERYQDSFQSGFPAYRVDRYASKADRAEAVGAPAKLPAKCQYLPGPVQHWVPFVSASGHTYYGGPAGCAGEAPESDDVGDAALPSNETFGVTDTDGRGSTKFDIWTSAENASLGCTQLVACSLVAVPIMGVSCDVAAKKLPVADRPSSSQVAAARQSCEAKGAFKPGELVHPQGNDDLTVSGSLWWTASNWRNRITVPLSFAVPANACDVVNSNNTVDVYGSEVLVQATGQWAPHFCLNKKLFKFTHVQTGEPEGRNLVASGGAEAAFISDPPPDGYGRTVVNAPVALGGFDITYAIDGANGQPYAHLRLTPRLLAKLLTESYPAAGPVKAEDPALANNPLDITLDPEFQKLNPGILHGVAATEAAASLLTLSSDSDVITALTTYINDDPTARAWLNGKPDPWGMVVNPSYKGIHLPVDKWPLLSTFEPKQFYAGDTNDCLHNSPVPFLPLVAAPLVRLEEISEAMQFSVAQSTTVCSQIDGTTAGEKLVALGRQTTGFRFMIGLSSTADARRYQLSSAELQTTNANIFVGPTDASMKAAAALLKPDSKTGTWPVPYQRLRTSKSAAAAYPGTLLVYAAVPTTGLPKQDAKDYATLLRYLATTGQHPGLGVGDLPPGYLPLTTANGLEPLVAYTYAAANDVAAQNNELPSLTGNPVPGAHPSSSPSSGPSTSPTAGASTSPTSPAGTLPTFPSGVSPTIPSVSLPPVGVASSGAIPSPSVAAVPPNTVAAERRTESVGLGGGGFAIVVIIGLAILGGLGTPTTYFVGRRLGRW